MNDRKKKQVKNKVVMKARDGAKKVKGQFSQISRFLKQKIATFSGEGGGNKTPTSYYTTDDEISQEKTGKKSARTDDKKTLKSVKNSVLALDIGTEIVKAMIGIVKDNGRIEVVGIGRKKQDVSNMTGGAIADIAGVISAAETAISEAENMSGIEAEKTVVGIAGELVKGETSVIRYRRPKPKKSLDDEEMSFIIDKVQARAAEKAREQVALETNNPDTEVRLVNSALVGISIDGYKVTNPIGFQGQTVAVQIYTAFAPMMHLGAIERVCAELGLELLAIAVEPFAVARAVIGNDSASKFSGVLMDIGGGTTDIAVINDGGVEGTRMFGVGGRSWTRQIENALGVNYSQAEKLKLAEASGLSLKADVSSKVDKAIIKVLATWIMGVQLALEDFDNVEQLPPRVMLCGGGAGLPQIEEALSETRWHRNLNFTRKPQIQIIYPESVVGISSALPDQDGLDGEQLLDYTLITAMGLLRVGADTLASIDDEEEETKLKKVLKN